MCYALKKPVTKEQQTDFIIKYNRQMNLRIEKTDLYLFALEDNEMMGTKEVDGEIIPYPVINPNYEQEQAEKEAERILGLSMTRSDFFDGTIKAFGADEEDLLVAISAVLQSIPISDLEKKIALNNYKNALNFYRKHPLFTLLNNVPIPITEEVSIIISSEQWDRFFDETAKGNEDAYKELLPPAIDIPEEGNEVELPVEEEEPTEEEN